MRVKANGTTQVKVLANWIVEKGRCLATPAQ